MTNQNEKITETTTTEVEKEIPLTPLEPSKPIEEEKPEVQKESITEKQVLRNFIGE